MRTLLLPISHHLSITTAAVVVVLQNQPPKKTKNMEIEKMKKTETQIAYRFKDRMILCGGNGEPETWQCYAGEEIGLLAGECWFEKDGLYTESDRNDRRDGLIMSAWTVRDELGMPVAEWERRLASLPKWNKAPVVMLADFYEEEDGSLSAGGFIHAQPV